MHLSVLDNAVALILESSAHKFRIKRPLDGEFIANSE